MRTSSELLRFETIDIGFGEDRMRQRHDEQQGSIDPKPEETTLPIRLSPTPTICSVSPWTAGKGRRRRIEEAIRLILDCSENRTGV